MTKQTVRTVHPHLLRSRVLRGLRFLRNMVGWGRLLNFVVSESAEGAFTVRTKHGWFCGNISSYIDRQIYLLGGYESDYIEIFLNIIPLNKRRNSLDIGANIGTHSIAFSNFFDNVHSFEPNFSLWECIEQNIQLNDLNNVFLYKFGLSDKSESLKFYITDSQNLGLGTACTAEQYDSPLIEHGIAKFCCGDDVVERFSIGPIDAIKVDVQGYEPQVLRGLARVLSISKPIVWLEISTGTQKQLNTLEDLRLLFPYSTDVRRVVTRRIGLFQIASLESVDELTVNLLDGDYIVVPRDL